MSNIDDLMKRLGLDDDEDEELVNPVGHAYDLNHINSLRPYLSQRIHSDLMAGGHRARKSRYDANLEIAAHNAKVERERTQRKLQAMNDKLFPDKNTLLSDSDELDPTDPLYIVKLMNKLNKK